MHISFIPQSYQDWSEDDLAVWMKAVNIDAYLGLFQAGGVTWWGWTRNSCAVWMKAVNIDAYLGLFQAGGVVRGCDLVELDEERLEG